MELKQFEGINKSELAMVNVAYAILEVTGSVTEFDELLKQTAEYLEYDDELIAEEMLQFYTDLNIDGRFISLGENRWGLREWFAIDSIDEELTHDNDLEDLEPRINKEGFDDYAAIEEVEFKDIDEEDEKVEEDEEDEVEYGARVNVDEHGVMVEEEDEEDLGEYKDDIEDIDEDEDELEGLSVVDDEDLLDDEDEDEE